MAEAAACLVRGRMVSLVTPCGQLDYGLMSLLVQPIKASTHMTDTRSACSWGRPIRASICCAAFAGPDLGPAIR